MLGVDVRTLYTYVSRKKLRTLRAAGHRQSLYWKADVAMLAGHAPPESGHSSSLVPVTAITLITPQGPYYRGQSAIALSETHTIEEVAAILWQVDAFGEQLPRLPENYQDVRASVAGLGSAERAQVLLSLVEEVNPRAYDFSLEGYTRSGADVVRLFASILAKAPGPSVEPLHQFIGRSLGVESVYHDLIRRALILGADHELDPTTYAVRARANTGVTPYAAVLTGIAAFRGRRLRMGRAELAMRLIDEVIKSDDPQAPIVRRFRHGEALPGFGSGVYAGRDPRATALFGAFDKLIDGDPDLAKLKAAIAVARELTGKDADFILASSFLRRKLGTAQDTISITAFGRAIGWIAHAIEQTSSGELVRPRAAYVGILPDASGLQDGEARGRE